MCKRMYFDNCRGFKYKDEKEKQSYKVWCGTMDNAQFLSNTNTSTCIYSYLERIEILIWEVDENL